MALEFVKLVEQVQTMGRYLGQRNRSLSSRLELALQWFYAADNLEAVQERIELVRRSSVSGYRGAAAFDEMICQVFPKPELPPSATLVAVDGSQIYPDVHAPTLYYLLNIGAFVCAHGEARLPEQYTFPALFYADDDIQDADGRLVSNQTVNARRSLAEMQGLAKQAWTLRGEARPLIAFHDGTLLKFFGAAEVSGAAQIERDYLEALGKLRDTGAVLAGYIDRPRSTYLISLLHLLSLAPDAVNDFNLKSNGELEGLMDVYLLRRVLGPGQRSAIMVQNSPQNLSYQQRDRDLEVAFFYLNVAESYPDYIVRVDIPLWVARNKRAVDELHALILAQCAVQGRRHYPYALTRADELAYVSNHEKQQLNELINVALLQQQVEHEASSKLQTKGLARGVKRQHRIGSR